jgi:hypothetical protein
VPNGLKSIEAAARERVMLRFGAWAAAITDEKLDDLDAALSAARELP